MARNTVAVTHCVRMQARTTPTAHVEVPRGDSLCNLPVTRLCDSHNLTKTVMSKQLQEIKGLIERLEHESMAYFRGYGTPGLAITHAINKLTEVYTNLGGDKIK
jgi:hypothetical protein